MKDASCARSTSQIKLVAHPVGFDGLLCPAARDLAHGTFSSENEPAFFIPTAVSGIAVTVLDGGAPGFWLRGAGVLAVLIWIVIRVIGTVPINSATLTWQPSAPPKNWKALVNHAERFHIVGVWAVVLAFALFLTAMALKLAAS
jgi:hypothetical protein